MKRSAVGGGGGRVSSAESLLKQVAGAAPDTGFGSLPTTWGQCGLCSPIIEIPIINRLGFTKE